ncbi:MAG: AlkZ family DNA glycosylase [Anaerolineae bacterium]|nr:AlkZ family DNA glycosylase [Anaerolineae bacterium]
MPLRLSARRVNRYVFAKQHLTSGTLAGDVVAAARDIGPIRAAPPVTPYISLWARVKDFQRDQLDTALYRARTLARAPCFHSQLCLMPAEQLPIYHQTAAALIEETLEDVYALLLDESAGDGAGLAHRRAQLTQRILEVLSARGPSTVDELASFLPDLNARVYHDPELPELGYSRLGTRLIPALCAQGLLVRAQPRGGWRSGVYSYTSLRAWFPDVDLVSLSGQEALRQAVWSYVRSFGPVTVGDIAHWLGGFARQELVAALMSFRSRVRHVQIEGTVGDFYMAADEIEACSQAEDDAAPQLVLLPARDSFPMAYSDTSRFLEPCYRDRVFGRFGEPSGTVWLDGRIVGTWYLQLKAERIDVRFFETALLEASDLGAWDLVYKRARSLAELLDFSGLDLDIGTDVEEEAQTQGRISLEIGVPSTASQPG